MSIQLVIQACQAVSDKGKQPSIALVKSYLLKSGNTLALAQIIRGVRAFTDGQRNPDGPSKQTEYANNENSINADACSCKQELLHLKQQMKALQAEFRALQAQVLAAKTVEKL